MGCWVLIPCPFQTSQGPAQLRCQAARFWKKLSHILLEHGAFQPSVTDKKLNGSAVSWEVLSEKFSRSWRTSFRPSFRPAFLTHRTVQMDASRVVGARSLPLGEWVADEPSLVAAASDFKLRHGTVKLHWRRAPLPVRSAHVSQVDGLGQRVERQLRVSRDG